jgi:putative radical SAM enzyme (TIGR03279 family)
MSRARVVAVAPGSPAEAASVAVGDVLVAINGQPVRDVIQYRVLGDEDEVVLELDRGGVEREIEIHKAAGEPLGIEVASAVFDEVRTCDNHCEFCFIYQLPPGMRRSLYVKDDDYRLSFLYGNFTTLTRFTEADLERVVTEGLTPLYVSIHATDPVVRSDMLRNRRGAMSLRWLRALLDHGVEVHGQVVVCPGLNDGDVLDDTMAGVLDEYPEIADLAVVPLGVSRHNREARMRPHTRDEAIRVVEIVESWQDTFLGLLGRPLVHAADEYYLLADRPFPSADRYGGFDMHEDGIGMARAFELEFSGATSGDAIGVQPGFFAWVDGAPAEGYRAPRWEAATHVPVTLGATRRVDGRDDRPIGILTGTLGAQVLEPLVASMHRDDVRVVAVDNRFFGGNIGVTGLMVGEDVARVLRHEPPGHRYLLPDVCLSNGTFLDGTSVSDLPQPVDVVATDGVALRRALDRAAA